MSDSERFLDGGGLAEKLLRAGIDEAPSPRVVQRTLLALGAGAATVGVAGVGAAAGLGAAAGAEGTATVLGAAGLAKFLAIGVVSGVAVSGASWGVTSVLEQRRDVERAPVSVKVERAAPATPAVVVPVPAVPEPVASVAEPVAPRATAAVEDAAPLAAEVALVDRAHAALKRGDAGGALDALGSYERTFGAPSLLPEVFALRMDASERLGDQPAARLWAGRLLSRFPKSAQASRARAVLDR